MSKWQLPTRKGTELFPQTIRSPVSVRFEGVPPGSPLARELYQVFRGEIDRFYLKNAQAFALGTVDQRGAHQQVSPELAMRYTNNQGHEIVNVRISKEVVHRVLAEAGEGFWDFALIELFLPPITNVFVDPLVNSCAVMRVPGIGPIEASTPADYPGVASWSVPTGLPDKVLNMARPGWAEHTTTGDYIGRAASWTVDMSSFGTIPEVGVDLYASVIEYVSGPGNPVFVYASGPLVVPDPPTSYAGAAPLVGPPSLVIEPGFHGYVSGTSDFDYVFDLVDSRYEYTDGSTLKDWTWMGSIYSGYVNVGPPANYLYYNLTFDRFGNPAPGNPYTIEDLINSAHDHGYPGLVGAYSIVDVWVAEEIYTPTGPTDTYTGPDPAPAVLQVTVFKSKREFTVGRYGDTEYRWDYPQWPERPGHLDLSGAFMTVIPTTAAPDGVLLRPILDSLGHVGTVWIDRKRGGAALAPG